MFFRRSFLQIYDSLSDFCSATKILKVVVLFGVLEPENWKNLGRPTF